MPRTPRLTGRAGPLGLAFTAYEIWRRLPPTQRQQMLKAMRKHGPTVATAIVARAARVKGKPKR